MKMATTNLLKNYLNGEWRASSATEHLEVVNPATTEVLGKTPLSPASEVDQAAQAAQAAFEDWRRTPPTDRAQYLFKLKNSFEAHFEELSRLITQENGKTLGEARGEMRRAIENVEVACGIPSLMLGDVLEDIASGIDEFMIRQPVGVCTTICPFNFPAMIPFWFMPYGLACGNTYIVKPSERTPLTMIRIFELIDEIGFPKGVVNLVHGSADTVNALLDHPLIRGVTFVGSTPVARHI
jgi:malonate-semialdehyde dehydrogenase (acetylating)/methylmalonate-semialdehyde dehydrogenase